MKRKYILLFIMSFCFVLVSCSKSAFALKEELFIVELGEQISTKAKMYLEEKTEKSIIQEASVSFSFSKTYTVDKKSQTLKAKDKDYLPVGKYEGAMKYKKKIQKFIVEIRDTTAPKFVDFKDELSIEIGSEVKLEDYFKAEDLSQVTITINKGKLDLTKKGSYEI